MFTNVKGVYGFLGVGLALVALYLVLTRAAGASQIITSGATAVGGIFETLQGR